MKKILLLILFVSVATMGFAKKSYLSVISGNVSVLNQIDKTAIPEFDYSKTYLEGLPAIDYLTNHGGDYVKDWPEDNVVVAGYFFNAWNDVMKNRGLKLVKAGNADYRVVVHVDSLDLGSTAGAMLGFSKTAGGCIICGTIDIVDCASDNVVCKLKVDKLKGDGAKFFDTGTNENRRRGLAYEKMAKQVVELAKGK